MINYILLIDDNHIDNFINKTVITKCKITDSIIVKTSAIDALDYLEKTDNEFPNIIFLDIRMPIMDGFQFLKIFEKFSEKNRKNTSVYMLSSSTHQEDVDLAMSFPFVKKFLNKPLGVALVNNLLTNYA